MDRRVWGFSSVRLQAGANWEPLIKMLRVHLEIFMA